MRHDDLLALGHVVRFHRTLEMISGVTWATGRTDAALLSIYFDAVARI
jgi:hypothetical protein